MSDKISRKYIRYPIYKTLTVVEVNFNKEQVKFNIILRDESYGGFGCVFVGENQPNTASLYYVIEGENLFRAIKLTWIKELYRNVFLLGFEIMKDELLTSIPI